MQLPNHLMILNVNMSYFINVQGLFVPAEQANKGLLTTMIDFNYTICN